MDRVVLPGRSPLPSNEVTPIFPLNVQVPEKQTRREDGILEVHDIWYTIQGEGPLAGQPAVFIRLSGCDLQCPDCDTDYTSKRFEMTPKDVATRARDLVDAVMGGQPTGWGRPPVVVFTGGEPFRQNFGPTARMLYSGFPNIQVETNGTMWQDDIPIIPMIVVCSPKTPMIHDRLKPYIKHLKYVIEAGQTSPDDGLPSRGVLGSKLGPPCRPWSGFSGTVWVQPLDLQDPVQNKANADECVRVAQKYGYRVSVQTHKILGVA